jgi:hypothetical protein
MTVPRGALRARAAGRGGESRPQARKRTNAALLTYTARRRTGFQAQFLIVPES